MALPVYETSWWICCLLKKTMNELNDTKVGCKGLYLSLQLARIKNVDGEILMPKFICFFGPVETFRSLPDPSFWQRTTKLQHTFPPLGNTYVILHQRAKKIFLCSYLSKESVGFLRHQVIPDAR